MSDELQARKESLQLRRNELADRLNRINMDYRQGLDPDFAEQAQQLENAEVLEEIARVTAEELNKIEQAIQRIEQAQHQN